MSQLASMTGFARVTAEKPWGHWVWEIRTLNQKYFDGHFQLPEGCQSLLPALRKVLQSHMTRGRCDTRLWYSKTQNTPLALDQDKVLALCSTIQQVLPQLPECSSINVMDVIRYVEPANQVAWLDEAQMQVLLSSFEDCVARLVQARHEEGQQLHDFMAERHQELGEYVAQLDTNLQRDTEQRCQIWQEWLNTVAADAEPATQDKVLTNFIQRHDVAEELSRLQCHLDSFANLLTKSSSIGRDLGFLLQEILREINTLGSKAIGVTSVQSVLAMKSIVEQMREQAQNIE